MTWGAPPYVLFRAFYTLFLPTILLGAGQENGRAGREGLGTCWEIRISLERGLWGLGWGGQKRHTSDKNIIPHARSGSQSTFPS